MVIFRIELFVSRLLDHFLSGVNSLMTVAVKLLDNQSNCSDCVSLYLNKFLKVVTFSERELDLIRERLISKTFKKNEYIVAAGEVSNHMHFIVSGLVRVFHLDHNKEVNTDFYWNNAFLTAYESFVTRKPSKEYLQCLEDTHLISIEYDAYPYLNKHTDSWETLCRLFIEQRLLDMIKKASLLQTNNAKDKYLNFVDKTPAKVIAKIPNYQIASYLGITAESLSRVRQKINQ